MANQREKWNRMFKELESFIDTQGHGAVPARYTQNPGLGYWSWNQRYKRKKGTLDKKLISKLTKAGFDWDMNLGVTTEEKVIRVIDGDTFNTEQRMKSVRLEGVDTPEKKEKGWAEAKQALTNLILNKKVIIFTKARDVYSRYIAQVNLSSKSVNKIMKNSPK